MQQIYSAPTLVMIEHVRAVLAGDGIATEIRNQYLNGALGDLPAFECWPELWLLNDGQLERAQTVVAQIVAPAAANATSWTCGGCAENIEPQFAICWSCGADAPPGRLSENSDRSEGLSAVDQSVFGQPPKP